MIDALPPVLVWSVGLGVLGAIVGSFLAALVVRWPEGRSVLHGRSQCDACRRQLKWMDLVPLVSAFLLNGKCRYCRATISPVHWHIEAAGVVVGVTAGATAPGIVGVSGAIFGWLLLSLGALDLVYQLLPDVLTGTLAVTGVIVGLTGLAPDPASRLLGGLAGYFALQGIRVGYRLVRKRDGMGGGDPKLLGAIGFWLGWQVLPAVVLIASALGLGVALVARVIGRHVAWDTAMSMGTLLAIAAYPAWLVMIGSTP